jgi:hypothetical protein
MSFRLITIFITLFYSSCSHNVINREVASSKESSNCSNFLKEVVATTSRSITRPKLSFLKKSNPDFSEEKFNTAYSNYIKNIQNYDTFDLPNTLEKRVAYFEAIESFFFKNGLGDSLVRASYNEDKIKRLLSSNIFEKGMSERQLKNLISKIYTIKFENVFSLKRLFLNNSTLKEDALYYYLSKEVVEHGLFNGLKRSGLLKQSFFTKFTGFFSHGFGQYFLLALYNAPFIQSGAFFPIFVKIKDKDIFSKQFLNLQLQKSFKSIEQDIHSYYGAKGSMLIIKHYFIKAYTFLAATSYFLFVSETTSFSARKEKKENEKASEDHLQQLTDELDSQLSIIEESPLFNNSEFNIGCMIFTEALNQYSIENGKELVKENPEYYDLLASLNLTEDTCKL